jgi:hypothetical protein
MQGLEPAVLRVVMQMLAAIYESGFTDTVDLGLLVQLFGVAEDATHGLVAIEFDSDVWVRAYNAFQQAELASVSEQRILH